jgi:hypothetical protein
VPQYLSDAKHYWSFFVRQNGPLPSGNFESSYSRYWKPGADPVQSDSTRANRDNSDVLTLKPDNKNVVVTGQVGSAPTKLNAKLVNDGNQFQLICRAGPDLRVSFTYYYWWIAFSRSTQPAHSGRNLQPGQCSPAEFSLRDGDPAEIQTPHPGDVPAAWTDLDGLFPWEKSLEELALLPFSTRITKLIEYLKDPQNYWTFSVKDDGQGDFIADYSQYWKPELYKGPTVSPFDERKKKRDVPNVKP